MEGEGFIREGLVGVLNLLEDRLEFLLGSLVVHQVQFLPSIVHTQR